MEGRRQTSLRGGLDEMHTADILLARHIGRQRRKPHVDIGIEADVPETALFIGQRGVCCAEIQIQNAAPRVTRVVPGRRLGDGGRYR